MKRTRTTEYFGGTTPLTPETTPVIRCDLEFDDEGVENISRLVFKGMRNNPNQTDLGKDDLRRWTKAIMAKRNPEMEFSEEMFE